jgi:predicted NAD/FAD-dependent oxidoreductase
MATRRFKGGVFDHGAQFFTVRDPRFQETVQKFENDGVVKYWAKGFPNADGGQKVDGYMRYRGNPGMTAIPKALAQGLDVRLSNRVEAVGVQDGRWQAITESGEVYYGAGLIMTPPVPQSLQLLESRGVQLPPQMAIQLQNIAYHPCIALLAILEKKSRIPEPGGMRVKEGAIRWIADNQQKGISPDVPAVTIHAAPDFSWTYWESEADVIAERLLSEAKSWVIGPVQSFQVHRWRYSQPIERSGALQMLLHDPLPLIFAGDAFSGGRVEGAALSGLYAAERLLDSR